jgi:hypothetical protein
MTFKTSSEFILSCTSTQSAWQGIFIQDGQHFVAAPVTQLVVNEVYRPNVVGMRRTEANDRTVFMVKPPSLFVPLRQSQPFLGTSFF